MMMVMCECDMRDMRAMMMLKVQEDKKQKTYFREGSCLV